MEDSTVRIGCDKCKLYETSKASLYGIHYNRSLINNEGVEGAPIMFIGEAPGREELIKDKPCVGSAGKQLRASLEKVGIKDFYISTVCRCLPPENKTPTAAQVSFCSKLHLYKTIERVKPKLLVLLGNTVLKEVLGFSGITKVAGKVFQSEKVKLPCIPVIHPSYVIRNMNSPSVLSSFEDSLRAVKSFIDSEQKVVDPDIGCKYITVSTMDQVERLINKLLEVDSFSYDLETEGFDWIGDKILCSSFSWKERTGVVIPFYHSNPNYMNDKQLTPFWQEFNKKRILEGLKEVLSREVWKYYNNGKFDNKFLRSRFNINPVGPFFDNMLAHHLLDENAKHDLDSMVLQYTDMGLYSRETKKYLSNKETSFAVIPQEVLWKYSAKDADAEFRVGKLFQPMIEEQELHDVFYKIVMPYSRVLEDMEMNGMKVDLERIDQIANGKDGYIGRIKQAEIMLRALPEVASTVELLMVKEKMKLQGRYNALKRKVICFEDYWKNYIEKHPISFNPRSVPQVRCLLYEVCKVTRAMTEGSLSTDVKVLTTLKTKVKAAKYLLELRTLTKFYGTYVKNIPGLVKKDGRLHTTFSQHTTVTGRLSSRKPNFQNQPKKGKEAKVIRSYFTPEPGNIFIEADYKAAEFRCLAECSQDVDMIRDLNNGLDIHKHIAAYAWKKLESEVTDEERTAAKGTVFGIMYGRGPKSIAKEYNIPETQAASIMSYFLTRYSIAARWLDAQKIVAIKNGYVLNYFGRRRRLPILKGFNLNTRVYKEGPKKPLLFVNVSMEEAEALRQAVNAPIQGMAHDCLAIAAVRFANEIERQKLSIKLLLDIHDALFLECPKRLGYQAAVIIKDAMERPIKDMTVRMVVELEVGVKNWAEMGKVNLEQMHALCC